MRFHAFVVLGLLLIVGCASERGTITLDDPSGVRYVLPAGSHTFKVDEHDLIFRTDTVDLHVRGGQLSLNAQPRGAVQRGD